ncbi:MAG TPA: methyltransferase domain-containing protein [Ktedonobacteraceae bacterium]|nr:methyltransferase domain-containing protein [Ktedonobacteraceae bacterium]
MQVSNKKPMLADIRGQQYFDVPALAVSAGVNESVINRMLSGLPVQLYQAELVLSALSDETGKNYTLDNVDVVLIPEHNDDTEDLNLMTDDVTKEQTNTYILDAESPTEMARLIDLHRVVTQAMGGPLAGVSELPPEAKVLDMACGPGGWVCDVAFERPDIEVAGIDVSKIMVEYAYACARTQQLSNASFGVMDITQPLDFSDGTFDLVNARFLVGVLRRKSWGQFLAECTRILKPGGILRLTEPIDAAGITTSTAYESLSLLVCQAFWRCGYGFSMNGYTLGMTTRLPRMLRQAGYHDVRCMAHTLEFSVDCHLWKDLYNNALAGSSLIHPFLEKAGVATQQDVERLVARMHLEWLSEEFCGMWHLMTVLGENQKL